MEHLSSTDKVMSTNFNDGLSTWLEKQKIFKKLTGRGKKFDYI